MTVTVDSSGANSTANQATQAAVHQPTACNKLVRRLARQSRHNGQAPASNTRPNVILMKVLNAIDELWAIRDPYAPGDGL
jgi:hypothetical protein